MYFFKISWTPYRYCMMNHDSKLYVINCVIISGTKIVFFLFWKSLDHIESEYPQITLKAVKWITKADLNWNQSNDIQEAFRYVSEFMFWQPFFPLIN